MNKTIQERSVFFGLHLYRMPECVPFLMSLFKTVKLLQENGYITRFGFSWGDPYIQKSRNKLIKQFLETDFQTFFFVADDLEWNPDDLLRVVQMNDDVVAGVYPQKTDPIRYPAIIKTGSHGIPLTRDDGCIPALRVQTGFLMIRRRVFENIIIGYPELSYYGTKNGEPVNISHDYFPQGVHDHKWVGEDYAFCDLWIKLGGEIWVVPDIDFTHYKGDKGYSGNYHEYLKSLPGKLEGN